MLVFLERENRDGSDAAIRVLKKQQDKWQAETLAHVGGSPDGLAIKDGKIYWTAMGVPSDYPNFCNADGTINVLESNNGSWANHELASGIVTPKQCCVRGDGLYFCDREGLAIYRLDIGTNRLDKLFSSGSPDQMLDCERQNVGCTVEGSTLYFTQKGPKKGGKGKICELDLVTKTHKTLLGDLPEPIDLLLRGDTLFWTDRGAPPNGNSLNCATLSKQLADHKVLVTGFDEAIGLTIDGNLAYVADLGGSIHEVDLSTRERLVVYHSGKPLTGIEYIKNI